MKGQQFMKHMIVKTVGYYDTHPFDAVWGAYLMHLDSITICPSKVAVKAYLQGVFRAMSDISSVWMDSPVRHMDVISENYKSYIINSRGTQHIQYEYHVIREDELIHFLEIEWASVYDLDPDATSAMEIQTYEALLAYLYHNNCEELNNYYITDEKGYSNSLDKVKMNYIEYFKTI